MSEPILNIAGYTFIALQDLPVLRAELKDTCRDLKIKGTILISEEGLNLFLAGEEAPIRAFLKTYADAAWLRDMDIKESTSAEIPFTRMLVRIKREIIAFGDHGVNALEDKAPYMEAAELKRWYEDGKEFLLLDTRNDYEIKVGTFKNAMDLNIKTFRAFPKAVKEQLSQYKDMPIVTVCTGGVRCEKAAPFLLKQGFKDVHQLQGGFLKYFETCGDAYYNGDCFVFDKRVALNPALKESGIEQCFRCRTPLTEEELHSTDYKINESCPHCIT